jgi:hypothetical protein
MNKPSEFRNALARSKRQPVVRPNPSFNRTLHSLPSFGLKEPSPNATNLFRAG